MKRLSLILISALCTASIQAQQVDFRGANHCGIYTNEKNLLKQWPEGGPQKLWVVNDAGKGNSSAVVSDGFIYTAGLTESEQEEQLTCYRHDGSRVWHVTYGRAWTKSFQETRSTPVVDDDRLYMVSNMGELVCLSRADGKILWKVDYWNKYGLTPNDQGICEHPLIDGNKVIVTTCGKDVCMAAFDKLYVDREFKEFREFRTIPYFLGSSRLVGFGVDRHTS